MSDEEAKSIPDRKRRWFASSLRTPLLLAVLAAIIGWGLANRWSRDERVYFTTMQEVLDIISEKTPGYEDVAGAGSEWKETASGGRQEVWYVEISHPKLNPRVRRTVVSCGLLIWAFCWLAWRRPANG